MGRKYLINEEQLRLLNHYSRMFDSNADLVKDLSSGEKDDIVYGFELGQMYWHLCECYHKMSQICNEIEEQEV